MNAEKSSAEPDALERRLAETPPRPAPAELRAAVLRAAANVGQAASLPAAVSVPSAPPAWWEHFFARFPLAACGLTACWLLAWLGGSADRWLNGPVAAAPTFCLPTLVSLGMILTWSVSQQPTGCMWT